MKDEIPVILLQYVDDLFQIGEEELVTDANRRLATKFEMKDLGMMHYFLGMEVWQMESSFDKGSMQWRF